MHYADSVCIFAVNQHTYKVTKITINVMEENSENTLIVKTPEYSFQYSYNCLPKNKMGEVRNKIREIIGTTTEKSVYDRICGFIEPRVSEARAFEQLFKTYGIKIEWGKHYEP